MIDSSKTVAARVEVNGIVQGVGFRQFVRYRARDLELRGWVRNRDDGRTVELVAEGPQEMVSALLEYVNEGPPGSNVENIDIEWITPLDLPMPFEIRR
jgi:acylphosphatase